jgi:hypothetical protein
MTTSRTTDYEIAPGYKASDWAALELDPEAPKTAHWNRAADIFDARIRKRFLEPVDVLISSEKNRKRRVFGFAILAIDFLVIETLQGFREGKPNHKGIGGALFTNFLKQWGAFPKTADAKHVYEGYRCALYHSGSTNGAFTVGVSGPMFDFKNDAEININRTIFHHKLTETFEAYLGEIRDPANVQLRRNFKKVMNAFCGLK